MDDTPNINLAAEMINEPLLMSPLGGAQLLKLFAATGDVEKAEVQAPETEASIRMLDASRDSYRPYHLENGIARVNVRGTLMHKQYSWGASTRYQTIINHLQQATEDDEVKATLLDMHTPGGAVYGCFDTAEMIAELAKEKPIIALCHDQATSAGMALASGCTRRLVTQAGDMGSVGVLRIHVSLEKAMERWGEKATMMFAGAHKVDGNPYQNLPNDVYERFLAETQELRHEFAELVSRGTGKSIEHVLGTEAAIYRGQKAIDIGFADEMVNGHKAMDAVKNYLAQQSRSTVGLTMSKSQNNAAASEAETTTTDTQDTQVETTEQETTATTPETEQVAETPEAETGADDITKERDRVMAIMSAGAENGCTDLAAELVEQGMGADAAKKVMDLAASNGNTQSTDETALDRVMNATEQPKINADSVVESGGNRLLAAHAKATGENL